MKICLTCSSFITGGGTGKFAINLVKYLIQKHDMTLVASKYNYKIKGLKFFPYRRWKYFNSLKILSDTINATKVVKNLDRKENFDIIHGQGECLYQDILSIHGCYRAWIDDLKRKKNLLYKIGMRLHPSSNVILHIEKKLFNERCYKKVTCDSNQVKNDLIYYYKIPEDDIIVIPHGLDIHEFVYPKKQEIRNKLRSKYNIKDDFVLLFAGHAFYKKGLAEIIQALKYVKDVKLLIVGNDNPGPFRSQAEKLGVSDRIIFTGKVPVIRDYYFAGDMFVFPTRHEPFGMVITEAMLCGLPVITSREAGATEIMTHKKDCLLLDNPADVNELAEKINLIINNNNLRKKIIRNGIKTAKSTSWEITSRKFLSVYNEALR